MELKQEEEASEKFMFRESAARNRRDKSIAVPGCNWGHRGRAVFCLSRCALIAGEVKERLVVNVV